MEEREKWKEEDGKKCYLSSRLLATSPPPPPPPILIFFFLSSRTLQYFDFSFSARFFISHCQMDLTTINPHFLLKNRESPRYILRPYTHSRMLDKQLVMSNLLFVISQPLPYPTLPFPTLLCLLPGRACVSHIIHAVARRLSAPIGVRSPPPPAHPTPTLRVSIVKRMLIEMERRGMSMR